jgi:lysophospholipase L1-like esterase
MTGASWRQVVLGASLAGAACGGGGGPTSPPTSPPPTVPAGATVVAVVFYDENGNGRMDGNETGRVPDVEVAVGGRTARTEKGSGQASVRGVPDGVQTLVVRAETLPPYYQQGPPLGISVPLAEGTTVAVPLTLPVERHNAPNVYMAFGDSITRGDGSADGRGYPGRLEARLLAHFGKADVRNRGADATNSYEAGERILRNLRGSTPAYTLVLYGTNDWHDPVCKDNPACPTTENLRAVLREVKDFGSLPVVGTVPPANPTREPASRNEWVAAVNERIKAMAREEGAPVADIHAAFLRRPDWATTLFLDHVHPNDAGYEVIAEAFFEAVSRPRGQ